MATRRGALSKRKTRENTEDIDELDFLASQQSSDDPSYQKLAEQFAAAQEKKKLDREKKFLQAATKQLEKDVAYSTKEVQASVEAVQSAYTKFLLDYAASEDRIHTLWCEILKEEEKLVTAAKEGHTAGTASAKKGEESHKAGLSKAKSACDEFQKVVDQVIPQH